MLVEIEGEQVRVFAGLSMRMRLMRILGPVRALRAWLRAGGLEDPAVAAGLRGEAPWPPRAGDPDCHAVSPLLEDTLRICPPFWRTTAPAGWIKWEPEADPQAEGEAMSERWLLYDAGCSVCAALAREMETLSGGRLRVRSLRDPAVQALLDRAHPGWRWEPMLLEIEGERVRVFTGLAMRWRLVQVLGPARALRVAQALCRRGDSILRINQRKRVFSQLTEGANLQGTASGNLKLSQTFRRTRRALSIFLILLAAGLSSASTSAYSICCKWSNNFATYRYGYLPMAFWDPTDRGASAWTSVPTSSWLFIKYSQSPNYVEWGGIDGSGNTLAVTTRYRSGNTILSFWIRYDKDENWYTGTGTPAGNQYDAWSIITHEFGHALGLNHTQSIYCPGNATDATMCPTILIGTTWPRSLETDDQNGISYLYP